MSTHFYTNPENCLVNVAVRDPDFTGYNCIDGYKNSDPDPYDGFYRKMSSFKKIHKKWFLGIERICSKQSIYIYNK